MGSEAAVEMPCLPSTPVVEVLSPVDPRARRVYSVDANGATEVPSEAVPFTCYGQSHEFPFAETDRD
jgi:hypothetical protein